jgi:hypothetical protein
MARAGVGKTSCLIHIAFDKLFREEKLVHISLKDTPEKIISHYRVVLSNLVRVLEMENEYETRALLDKNRIILAYLRESFDLGRLRKNLENLAKEIDFIPNALIVDGFDFAEAGRSTIEEFREIARELQVEVWFSALVHRHISEVNERGIPFPCNAHDDLFGFILQLFATLSGVFLKLLKDHDSSVMSDAMVRLDPDTFLVVK